jgi:hypothetical protein
MLFEKPGKTAGKGAEAINIFLGQIRKHPGEIE